MALPRRIRLFAPLPTNLASAKPITVPPRQEIPPLRLQSSLRSRPRPTRTASQHLPRIHRLSRPRRRHLRRRPRRRRSPAARLRRRHGPEAGPSLAGRLLEELGRVSLGREEKRCFVFCLFFTFPFGCFSRFFCTSSSSPFTHTSYLPRCLDTTHDDTPTRGFPLCTKTRNLERGGRN
jgi:hypothetical protein